MSKTESVVELEEPPFAQERARKTHEALLNAAAEVFNELDYHDVRNNDIAKRAGVSIGTFYRYFGDKQEIFAIVQRRWLSYAYRDVMKVLTSGSFDGQDSNGMIRECVRALFEHAEAYPMLQRMFFSMALQNAGLAEVRRQFEEEAHRQITAIIEALTSREQVADPAALAYVLQTAAIEVAVRSTGTGGYLPVSRERCIDALSTMVDKLVFSERGTAQNDQ